MGLFGKDKINDPYDTMGEPAGGGILRRAARRLTEPREGNGSVMRWDCPFCPGLFRSAEAAAEHAEKCSG